MRTALLAALVCGLAASPAIAAESNLTGKDAAHIDWGVKNCGVTSTDKEHTMVEQANAKGRDQFVAQWTTESNKLVDAASTSNKQDAMCGDIKGWYGPQGSRIAGLISWKSDAAPSTTKAKSTGQDSTSRKGRKRSGQ